MYQYIGALLLRAAVWCLHNPKQVEAGYADIHALVDSIKAAKAAKK